MPRPASGSASTSASTSGSDSTIAQSAADDTIDALTEPVQVTAVFDGPIKIRIICGPGSTIDFIDPHTIH